MRFRYSIKNLVLGNSRSDALKCEKALIIHRVKKTTPGWVFACPALRESRDRITERVPETEETTHGKVGGTMARRFLVLCVCAAVVFGIFHWTAGNASADERHSIMDAVFSAIENAENLDLSDGNIKISSYEGPVSNKDKKFMALLRAKIRLAHIFRHLEYPEENLTILKGYEVVRMMLAAAASGSLNTEGAPFDLGDYIVFQLILPLELEPLIKELPAYYTAVKSKADWQEKFNLILETGDAWGPSLNRGKTFHLAGFPKVNTKKEYTMAIDVEFKDESLYYSEADSSIEAWLYSFWLRRYQEGSMETVKTILDWLNKKLDEVEKAVG